jgi:hypothetical protein
MKKFDKAQSRRNFLSTSAKLATGSMIFSGMPTIVPASVFGKNAPSNMINVASIGCGRISTSHDMTGISRYAGARIMAVCDVDRLRADAGVAAVKNNYIRSSAFNGGLKGDWDIKVYYDYKEMLKNKDIDAVTSACLITSMRLLACMRSMLVRMFTCRNQPH